ncbi:MAG: hypothetical protein ABMA14_13580 [Hyphomonadaceae bacterium]
MEPIERELADRKARLQRMATDVRRLQRERMHEPDDARRLTLYRDIAKLRYEISQSEANIRELEDIIREGPQPPRRPRPPLPNAKRLTAVERQRIEKEMRDKVLGTLSNGDDYVVHVYVGKTTDERGEPQVSIHVLAGGRRRPREE